MISRKWGAVAGVLTCLIAGAALAAGAGEMPPVKKLIEYGWDVRTPAYVRDHIREMEKRPFDGLIMRLAVGGRIFMLKPWTEEMLAPDYEALQAIKWDKFRDNFLCMYAASNMDWFSDQDWALVLNKVRLIAHGAKLGRCKGVCFDQEPYGGNPWHYPRQAHAAEKSFAEYEAQVRKRGAEFMRTLMSEMPAVVVHTFFQLGYFSDLYGIRDPQERAQRLSGKHYALLPAFLNGMLDAAGPEVIITDGNESSYYYQEPEQFYRAFHNIRQGALRLVAPENVRKYQTQVQASNALYVDQIFNLRTKKFLSAHLTPEERAQWFEQNVYYALKTSDEYVWCYSEKMNWWENRGIPPGLEEAIKSARQKIRENKPLGLDVPPMLKAAQKRWEAELEKSLIRRTAQIRRLKANEKPPVIDGELNDPVWQSTKPLEAFLPYVTQKDRKIEAPTTARVVYDGQAVYIGVVCTEPKVAQMKIVGQDPDSDIWMGDSIDIFLQPDAKSARYYHFILNPRNVHWDAVFEGQNDLKYNPAWNSAAKVADGKWVAEVAIPWSALQVKAPKPGDKWRANLCRQRLPGREQTAWSQTRSGFMEADKFGTWIFR